MIQIGTQNGKYTSENTSRRNTNRKIQTGEYKSEHIIRKVQFDKCKSEHIIRKMKIERIRIGESTSENIRQKVLIGNKQIR